VHNIDLTGHQVPWEAIGQLDALEELSLWNCGLAGPIEAGALCGLRDLRVLAVSQNALYGTVPECVAELSLQWLWLDENRVHGPISEYSSLGQFLKNVDSRNLAQNRWAPLLRTEKAALEAAAEPLGVTAAEPDWVQHGWDFSWSYGWQWVLDTGGLRLTAEREGSLRYWGVGVPFDTAFFVSFPFEFPRRGAVAQGLRLGPDADISLGSEVDEWVNLDTRCRSKTCDQLGWLVISPYTLDDYPGTELVCGETDGGWPCTTGPWPEAAKTCESIGARMCTLLEMQLGEASATGCGFNQNPIWAADSCAAGHMIITLGSPGEPGECLSDDAVAAGASHMPIGFRCCADSIDIGFVRNCVLGAAMANAHDQSCWKGLPELVPDLHAISEAPETSASSQGADYLSEHFCPGWAKFITSAACDPADLNCSGDDASGSAIFDGGSDMYDLGNVLTTSLMGDCTSDPHGCPIGSLRYHTDFAPVETDCFGPGGHYQMAKLDGVWVFFAHNTADVPLDFAVVGNLGSDGSGTVTEYTFAATPYVGFVKRECGAGDDPSINHLIIIDGVGGRPVHSCNQATGGLCDGASSDIDDDIVNAITPGSPILYLLYSSEGGRCIKEDEHHAIFDAAVRCLWAEDPYAAAHQSQQVGDQPLMEVVVDNRQQLVFGGTAPYSGWSHGSAPRRVPGPGSFPTALQFEGTQWLQLGESGVEAAGNWTLDCYVQVDAQVLHNLRENGVLMASQDGTVHIGAADLSDLMSSLSDGWHRLTVQVQQQLPHEDRTLLVDGLVASSASEMSAFCGVTRHCPTTFFAVGGRPDGSAPFPMAVHHPRLYDGILTPQGMSGSTHADNFGPLGYHSENSRWVEISRGPDAVDITWDTLGWDAAAHEQVRVTLEPTGDLRLKGANASRLWDRAITSASGSTDHRDVANWTSAGHTVPTHYA
jgi:hypothetical protein